MDKNELQDKIGQLIMRRAGCDVHAIAWNTAGDILALIQPPAGQSPPAREEKQEGVAEGVEIVQANYGWDVRTKDGKYRLRSLAEAYWEEIRHPEVGVWSTESDARSAALRAPKPPVEKPDPRKIAPNGRAMVRYGKNHHDGFVNIYGHNGERWWWWHPYANKWDTPSVEPTEPCTFDGSPVAEAGGKAEDHTVCWVTREQMLRLADEMDRSPLGISDKIRAVFKP